MHMDQAYIDGLLKALFLSAGYNSALVAVGAACLGLAAGGIGSFVFLRKRALVSDAVAHATLPGVCLAFIIMVLLGGDGRFLPILMLGSIMSSWAGLYIVEWMTRRTRLSQDAAIGAVLSVFFGLGIVMLTVIQNMSSGRQAGLEGFLLGSTAGMLYSEAITIAITGAVTALVVFIYRRNMIMVSFDTSFADTTGVNVKHTDLIMMGLVLTVTVIGLKIVGLILIVAMLIIPAVTARFWTNRTEYLILIAAMIGGLSGYLGAAISNVSDKVPTGPIIVLVAFFFFTISLLISPVQGVVASLFKYWAFQRKVHLRQGLLALAHGERVYDRLTLSVLKKNGYIRADGVATYSGCGAAAKALRDEVRWKLARRIYAEDAVMSRYDGLTPIEEVLTSDEISEIDKKITETMGVAT